MTGGHGTQLSSGGGRRQLRELENIIDAIVNGSEAAQAEVIGVLLEADITCFEDTRAGNPAIGPGSRDAYAARVFERGPVADGREMSWTHGSGGFAIYATTRAGY